MQRDIFVHEIRTLLEIVCGLTERGHGFEVEMTDKFVWRVRLTGAF
jgi:hypothetical protein